MLLDLGGIEDTPSSFKKYVILGVQSENKEQTIKSEYVALSVVPTINWVT